MWMKRLAATLALAVWIGAPADGARAGNQNSFFLGDLAALSGGAVAAVTADGAALWYNPAGLATEDRDTIDVSGSAYMLRIRDFPSLIRGQLPDGSPVELDMTSTEVITVPSALSYVRNLSPGLSLGFGLFSPLADRYDASAEVRLHDDVQDFDGSLRFTGDTTTYAAMVGLGWRAMDTVQVGAAMAFYYQSSRSTSTLLFGFDLKDGSDQSASTGTQIQEDVASVVGMNVQLGAQWRVLPELSLGLVVRSPSIQVYESLEQKRFHLGAEVDPGGAGQVNFEFAPTSQDRFTSAVYLSVSGTLAVAWTPSPSTFLALEIDGQAGSSDPEVGLERKPLWNVRLGGVFAVSDTLRIGAGLFTDRSWQPAPREPGIDRTHYYGAAAGLYLKTPLVVADPETGRDSLIFTSAFAVRYAIGLGETLPLETGDNGIVAAEGADPIDLMFHEISLHVGSGLHF